VPRPISFEINGKIGLLKIDKPDERIEHLSTVQRQDGLVLAKLQASVHRDSRQRRQKCVCIAADKVQSD